jgi:hypothetical protein
VILSPNDLASGIKITRLNFSPFVSVPSESNYSILHLLIFFLQLMLAFGGVDVLQQQRLCPSQFYRIADTGRIPKQQGLLKHRLAVNF